MKEMTFDEKLNQPLPLMKQKKYQVLYKLMLKNHRLKTQKQLSEASIKVAYI